MSKKTGYLLGILLTIIAGTIVYYFTCCNCTAQKSTVNTVVTTPPAENKPLKSTIVPFVINDDASNFNLNINDNISFKTSNFNIIQPVPQVVNNAINTLSNYLKTNPNKAINITGLYRTDETNNSAYPNLGIARATAVKNYFVSKGYSSKRINTFGKTDNQIQANANSIFTGPLHFNIKTETPEDASKLNLNAVKKALNSKPLILYFKTGESTIKLSKDQRQKIATIARYLDKAENASIQITGHTDNTGERRVNIELGQGRADFAKGYLVKNGIPANKIKTTSKGPDEPVASNATPEGRTKNRRTIITIN